MDFFWIVVIMIFVAALSILGTVVWWALVVFGIFKVAKYANRQFEAQLRAAEVFAQQLPQTPAHRRMAAEAQMAKMLSNLNMQRRQLDDLARQQYDARMGDLMNTAGSAGIDWTPPPY